jgi:hypothetical protein
MSDGPSDPTSNETTGPDDEPQARSDGTDSQETAPEQGAQRDSLNATESDESDAEDEHFDELEAGAGCTEIWEHLSKHRSE